MFSHDTHGGAVGALLVTSVLTFPLLFCVYVSINRRGAIPRFLAQMWKLLRLHRSVSSSALTSRLQLLGFSCYPSIEHAHYFPKSSNVSRQISVWQYYHTEHRLSL